MLVRNTISTATTKVFEMTKVLEASKKLIVLSIIGTATTFKTRVKYITGCRGSYQRCSFT